LLNHDRAIPNAATSNDVADANFYDVASAQLNVDHEVEKCSVRQPPMLVKPEANSLDLLRFTRALCTQHSSLVPRAELAESWIYRRVSHR
jgi:hypothetical protein